MLPYARNPMLDEGVVCICSVSMIVYTNVFFRTINTRGKTWWTHTQLYYQPPSGAQHVANEQEIGYQGMGKDGVVVGIGRRIACVEVVCVCDTTCNGTKATRTSCIRGVTKPFLVLYQHVQKLWETIGETISLLPTLTSSQGLRNCIFITRCSSC